MKEKIAAIKEYLKYFPDDYHAQNNLLKYEYAEELGIELGDKRSYYPAIEYNQFVINPQIKVSKKYNLTNSATGYNQNGKDSIVIWSESCGRLAFVRNEYWWDIDGEWNEFMDILKLYNPLDYDYINNVYIYNIENGKRLIDDYDQIIENFMGKVNKKIKEVQLEEKRKKFEQLKNELEKCE